MDTNAEKSTETGSAAQVSMSGMGYLVVKVSAARGAIPLPGASVTIRADNGDDPPTTGNILAILYTDEDGKTERFPLPAPARTESLVPGSKHPYAIYHIEVVLDGYGRQTFQNIPIFDGITALQPANMIPLPGNGRRGDRGGEGDFTDTAPNDL